MLSVLGSLPAIFFMEQMMEHIARTLNKDAATIKALNFYKQGQVNVYNIILAFFTTCIKYSINNFMNFYKENQVNKKKQENTD